MDKKGVFEDRWFKLEAAWKEVCYRQEGQDSNGPWGGKELGSWRISLVKLKNTVTVVWWTGGGGLSWELEGKRKGETTQVTQEHERSSWRNSKLSHKMTWSAWALQSSILLIGGEHTGRGAEVGKPTGGCWSSPDMRDGGLVWRMDSGSREKGTRRKNQKDGLDKGLRLQKTQEGS